MSADAGVASLAPSGPTPAELVGRRRSPFTRWWHWTRVSAAIVVVGLAVTAAAAWIAWRIDRNSEHRLLVVQTRQAADVVSSAIVAIESPLQTGLDVATATAGSQLDFSRFMASYVGSGQEFVSAALWRDDGSAPIATSGASFALTPSSAAARAFVAKVAAQRNFQVTVVPASDSNRLGYGLASAQDPGYVIYAERAIPANRRVPIESSSAFADLHFATYLGSTTNIAALQTTDQPLNRLPLTGGTVRETIPFGNTSLTLITKPDGHLGGALGAELPWILLVAGVALTIAATVVAGQLDARRTAAEADAQTITSLYGRLDDLYREQRTIAETLQRALIPQTNPVLPGVAVASRYVAGARGVDVGGDWFSLIRLDDARFGFVVGDVSGRGVDAAALMARIRFTLRAYLFEGHSPDAVLQMCARQVDIAEDRHFATVLVGIAEFGSRRVIVANAGHLNPLIVSGEHIGYVQTAVGLPLGVKAEAGQVAEYPLTTIEMAPGSMFLAFTDGLVERRGEPIADGLERLRSAAATAGGSLDNVVTTLLSDLTNDRSDDDTAILGVKWRH